MIIKPKFIQPFSANPTHGNLCRTGFNSRINAIKQVVKGTCLGGHKENFGSRSDGVRPFHIQGGFQRPDAIYGFGPALDVERPNPCSWNPKRVAKEVQIRLRCVTPVGDHNRNRLAGAIAYDLVKSIRMTYLRGCVARWGGAEGGYEV